MAGVTASLRDLWARVFLRGVHYADRHTQLDTLYRLENPWSMDSPSEQARFQATNDVIVREFGQLGTLFELGSGEGHQSVWLRKVCGELHGREISARAAARARKRCPDAYFSVGDLDASFADGPAPPFDLVAACEVLYYLSNTQAAVNRLSELGRACIVTYFETQEEHINGTVDFPQNARREKFWHDGHCWNIVYWKNNSQTPQAR